LQLVSMFLLHMQCVTVHAVRVFAHSLGGVAALAAEIRQPGTFRAMYLFEPVIYDP
jgi:pimeloyl-ACP methyl ester carboxylesterase